MDGAWRAAADLWPVANYVAYLIAQGFRGKRRPGRRTSAKPGDHRTGYELVVVGAESEGFIPRRCTAISLGSALLRPLLVSNEVYLWDAFRVQL